MVKLSDDNGYDTENSSEGSLPSVIYKVGESDTDTSVGSNNEPDSSEGETPASFPSLSNRKKEKKNDSFKSQKEVSFEKEDEVESPTKTKSYEVETGTDNEEYEMVLIKKPIELSTDDLKGLNLFKLAKKEKKFTTDNGVFVSTLSETKKMLYVPCPTFVTEEDKIISPTGSISSTITITRVFDESVEEKEIHIPTIRRKPILKLGHLKQRLKPYGVPPKKQKSEK